MKLKGNEFRFYKGCHSRAPGISLKNKPGQKIRDRYLYNDFPFKNDNFVSFYCELLQRKSV